jgi:hypothetical protein
MRLFYLVLRASAVIFLSLILAAVALVYVGIEYPQALDGMLVRASMTKDWLTDTHVTGLDVRYNVWVKFLLQEQQFVFMFFVVVMRIALLLLFSGASAIYRRIRPAQTRSV